MASVSPAVAMACRIAAVEAIRSGAGLVEPEHLLIGLLSLDKVLERDELPESAAAVVRREHDQLCAVLARFGLDGTLRRSVREKSSRGSHQHRPGSVISRSPAARAVLARAEARARGEVGALPLLCALLEDELGLPAVAVRDRGVDPLALRAAALDAAVQSRGNDLAAAPGRPGATPFLDRFGTDLTRLAAEGKLQEGIGMRDVMLQIVRTLARTSKNNPLLLGEPGVGKTAVVETLACRIARGDALPGRRLIQLAVADLLAGTKFRGEFEERLQCVIREAASPDVILFIDEIHTVVGAGDGAGGVDAANILKPALARGELRCIGATTIVEHRKYIEGDAALDRRFHSILIEEPTREDALTILRGIAARLSERHAVEITEEAVTACVDFAICYLPERRLPDKAIDLLEEACTRVAVPALTISGGEKPEGPVTAQSVAEIVAQRTGIPAGRLTEDERARLLRLPEELKARVIGQDAACEAVARAVIRARSGLGPLGRPIAVLLFAGPTGVGKTELARATAAFLFGSERHMIRLDMTEFAEKHTVSRLVGAPPGYLGHDEEGQLTGALRRTPFSLVLLDEVEKAHPEVLNLFLQIFDEGRLTDSRGRTVDASNSLFVLTSNAGQVARRERVGFRPGDSAEGEGGLSLDELHRAFRPEFLNRLDEIVQFNSLRAEDIRRIARLMLGNLEQRLVARGLDGLLVREAALDLLVELGSSRRYGARELRRAIERLVEAPLAALVLEGGPDAGIAIVDAVERKLHVRLQPDPDGTV